MHDIREIVLGVDEETREKSARFFVERGFRGGARLKCKRCVAMEILTEDQTVEFLSTGPREHCGFPMELEPIQ